MNSLPRIQAIAFDAFGTLFDVYSVGTLAEQHFPGNGKALAEIWRRKQIEYALLRTLGERYQPFWEVTCDALDFAARQLDLPLSAAIRTQLLNQYACLSPFPENLSALKALKDMRIPIAILSNGTPKMLSVCLKSAGMADIFDHILSVDGIRKYKPDPAAYALGPAAFGHPAHEILFVSSNGWDIAGAAWFGYATFWLNRTRQPQESLDIGASATGTQLTEVVDLVRAQQRPTS